MRPITPEKVIRVPGVYNLPAAETTEIRERNMRACLAYAGRRRLRVLPEREGVLHVVGYGTSLMDTWQHVQHPFVTTSGAHHFMVERDMQPDYHVEIDPREHKVACISPPTPRTRYLMSSACHPRTWDQAKPHQMLFWHAINGPETVEWVQRNDPNGQVVISGSSAGLAGIMIGGVLGYRRFALHGFDGSYLNGLRHAGPHSGPAQGRLGWQTPGGAYFSTSRAMVDSAIELMQWIKMYKFDCTVYGQGLLPTLVDEANLPNARTAQ